MENKCEMEVMSKRFLLSFVMAFYEVNLKN